MRSPRCTSSSSTRSCQVLMPITSVPSRSRMTMPIREPELIQAEFDVHDDLDGLAQRDDLGSHAVFGRQEDVLDPGVAVAVPEELELWNVQIGFGPPAPVRSPAGSSIAGMGAAEASRSTRWASDSCMCLSRSGSKSKVDRAGTSSPWCADRPG